MAGKCTIEGVKSGLVDTDDLMRLNALLDMSEAYQEYGQYLASQKNKKPSK